MPVLSTSCGRVASTACLLGSRPTDLDLTPALQADSQVPRVDAKHVADVLEGEWEGVALTHDPMLCLKKQPLLATVAGMEIFPKAVNGFFQDGKQQFAFAVVARPLPTQQREELRGEHDFSSKQPVIATHHDRVMTYQLAFGYS